MKKSGRSKQRRPVVGSSSPAYGHVVGTVDPELIKRKLLTTEAFVVEVGDFAENVERFCAATTTYAGEIGALAHNLLSLLDAPWVDQLEDNLLLKSLLNFGGVLESMSSKYMQMVEQTRADVIEPLETFGTYGAKDVEAYEMRLDNQFMQYEAVYQEFGKELSGKNRGKQGI